MTALPWQNLKASEEIIVIFDAAHAVEQEELERFLRAALQEAYNVPCRTARADWRAKQNQNSALGTIID